MARELQQVTGEHRAPSVAVKGIATAPCATTKSEGALERGDVALDARSEVSESAVGLPCTGHLGDGEAEMLAEDDVLDAERAELGEISSRSKSTVEDDVARHAPRHFGGALHRRYRERRIARIAGERLKIEHHSRRTGGKADLVAVERLASVLDDHVGMGLEDGHDFFLRWHLLLMHHATDRLIRDTLRQRAEMKQFVVQLPSCRFDGWRKRSDHFARAVERARRELQDFAILWHSEPEGSRTKNLEHPSSNASEVVDESSGDPAARPLHEPHEHADAVTEQRRVGRVVNVGVDDGAINSNARAEFPPVSEKLSPELIN
jgi:hypothetical protein